MRPGEYRSAVRGESWKFQLMATIDLCMRKAKTGAEFVQELERRGYQVRWEATRQCITYTTPKGKKCRDNRLHETRYRKEVMELEFRIREAIIQRGIETEEFAARDRTNIFSRAVLPHGGTMGSAPGHSEVYLSDPDGPDRHDEVHPHHDAGNEITVRGADQGTADHPSAIGTGWEEERVAAFAAPDQPASAILGMAVGHPDYGGLVHDLVRLGRSLEQPAGPPPPTVPVSQHSDRKVLAKERAKKIAMGHKPDDHEDQTYPNLSQTM